MTRTRSCLCCRLGAFRIEGATTVSAVAGLGVILTAVLSIIELNDIRAIKALKNPLATCVSLAATLIFIVQGAVRWPETSAMLLGAMIGGYAGGHLIRILPASVVRQFVIVAGVATTAIYAARYWF